ncbi:hypothetical protein MBLNU459_g7771t3 [Dothideomycetes sp. NU459]
MTSLSMVYVFTLGVGIPTTLQYSVLADITRDTGISTADLVQGTGVMFLFLGWACLFWQPIALAYGRRGVYLVSTLLTVPIMVWTAYSTSAGEWYAHRVLLGIVCSPIESLPEKLNYMGLYGFVLFGSNFIAPLIAGWFENAYGWRWTMHFGAMIAALSFFIHLFFMEESMYFRNTVEGIEIGQPAGLSTPSSHSNDNEKSGSVERATSISSLLRTPPPPRTYIQKFNPFLLLEGRPSTRQMFTMMYRPLLMIVLFPSVAWAGFTYGINLSWYQVLNGTASPVLSASPYNWSAALVGCVYVGPLIGAALGAVWSGVVTDRIALFLARRNNGIREPEHCLWPLAISAILSTAGLMT